MITSKGIFVSGTDTGVGKTMVAIGLLRSLAAMGARAVGMKPVAAGVAAGETINGDVRALIDASSIEAPLRDVNPYSYRAAIAPHLAARAAGETIDLGRIATAYGRLAALAEFVVVEGAGGLLVPLDGERDMLEIPRMLELPILLVVGIRLGCLNHALLSALALETRGIRLAGWVANRIDSQMAEADANVATLEQRLPAPLIADVGYAHPVAIPSLDRGKLQLLGL